MFPLGSAKRRVKSLPIATFALILLNAYVFYLEVLHGEKFVLRWAANPSEVKAGFDSLETIFTSMFLHVNWLHLASNMLFLWAFGPLVEDAMASIRFLLFYIFGGLAAMTSQVFFGPDAHMPVLGASGAIAAIMGAFLIIHPRDHIRTFVMYPIGRVMLIPAILLVGVWILLQVANVWIVTDGAKADNTVAYTAHIGGAIFGMLCGRLFLRPSH